MTEPRLKTEIRVSAHLRRAQGAGAFATIVRRGDPDAGAVAVKVYIARGDARLYTQSRDMDGNAVWREPFESDQQTEDMEEKIDAWLARETAIDPDLWIVEIEDREGRAFLD
ncbi:DUF1491 family protein [Hyphococcus sp.]|uniref:DUF1491 family protein n=1 Tax=Hyphococcus sp. TaxID=2038636 RepID=UPI003CCC1019